MYKVIVKNKKSPTSFGRNDKMKTVKNILKTPFNLYICLFYNLFAAVNQFFKLKLTYR